jgi:Rod binding domain-containing protein
MSDFSIIPFHSNMEVGLQRSMSEARQILKDQADAGQSGKISKAAKDFEAILLAKWLDQAEQSFATVPGGEDDDDDQDRDPGREQFSSIAMQSLGANITGKGGIGIAKMIEKQLGSSAGLDHRTAAGDRSPSATPAVVPDP